MFTHRQRLTRAIGAGLVTAVAALLAACSPITVHNEPAALCEPTDRNIQIKVELSRPARQDSSGTIVAEAQSIMTVAEIIYQAWSPEPGYEGVILMSHGVTTGISKVNPIIKQVGLPYEATVCWGAVHPVGMFMRAYVYHAYDIDPLDTLTCTFKDFDDPDPQRVGNISHDEMLYTGPVDAADTNQYMVQCQDIYTPFDWTGDPVRPAPPRP
jgi:hypothetical protein